MGWTQSDSAALVDIFDAIWELFNTKFYALGFETSLFNLIVTGFVILFVFAIIRRLAVFI